MNPRLKILFSIFSFFFVGILSGCGDDEKETRLFTLTINNGTGSGEFKPQSFVTISAAIPLAGEEFDVWTGDSDVLTSTKKSVTSFSMPERDIALTATYKPIDLGPPVALSIDKSIKYQTIDGFGFFGAQDVWWGASANMWNSEWGKKVITDLGITIWRNEYFPPATPTANQDADWVKQKPVVEGLKSEADKAGVDLKFLFTVWSPPADMKWQSNFSWPGDAAASRSEGTVSTKNGGTLNPNKYTEFANWLKDGIQLYKDAGVDVYGISMQNEPMFTQSFNSCTYTFTWYNDLLINVAPKIKTGFPDVKIFGSEHMLDMEGATKNWPYFYHANIKNNSTASANLDVLAVHGYTDGVAPSSGSGLAERWTNHLEQFSTPMNKSAWMTETSGYSEQWLGTADKPGALSLGQDIHAGLYYGNISAWVWWQGSQLDGIGEYNLMNGTTTGKKYQVSKHFYRYIRPGAVRIKATGAEAGKIFLTAYEHTNKGTMTIVVINSDNKDKRIYLDGTDIPTSFKMYRTTSGAENCQLIDTVTAGVTNAFVIPAKSIITLQAGGDSL